MSFRAPRISFSIVSHGQSGLVSQLLDDLERINPQDFEVIVTVNIPEDMSSYQHRPYPLSILSNTKPAGFGANHNAAFQHSRGEFFAVVNPDIRMPSIDLNLLTCPFEDPAVAAVAPAVLSIHGKVEETARHFPTWRSLIKRAVIRDRQPDYPLHANHVPFPVDWVGGMFVLLRPDAYRRIGGFDARRFFMYYEDVDICQRLHAAGSSVLLHPQVSVVHMAQRASHRQPTHMWWHATSLVRYLTGL